MIPIELGHALILYSVLLAVLIASIWIYTEFFVRRPQRSLGKQFLWRCEICRLSYLDEAAGTMSKCPRCESFNVIDEANDPAINRQPEATGKSESEGSRRNPSRRSRPNQRRRGPRSRR